MAYDFKLPDVGEGIHEGEIVRWRVKLGETVKEDQPLIEVETAKAIVELPSPKAGVILKMQGKEGETIHVGDTIVVIGAAGETLPDSNANPKTENPPPAGLDKMPTNKEPGAASTPAQGDAAGGAEKSPGVVGQIPTEMGGFSLPTRTTETVRTQAAAPKILPKIRKLAKDLGIDIGSVKGSGPGGEVTEADVKGAANSAQPAAAASTKSISSTGSSAEKFGPVDRTPLKGMRKAIADHMVKSVQTMPHVTHCDEFNAASLVGKRTSQKPDAEKAGVKLTYLAYIIQACVEALKQFPDVNASIDDSSQEIVQKKYFNIGIAVDTPEGLMLPVIKNADQKDLFDLAREIVELAEKCRTRTVTTSDLEGATFSITNIGSIGGTAATPIIPYGQSAILGVMKLSEQPVVVGEKIEPRPVMSLCLSYDHRLIDGAMGARFMNAVIAELQK